MLPVLIKGAKREREWTCEERRLAKGCPSAQKFKEKELYSNRVACGGGLVHIIIACCIFTAIPHQVQSKSNGRQDS